jgi:hypothetical protein
VILLDQGGIITGDRIHIYLLDRRAASEFLS